MDQFLRRYELPHACESMEIAQALTRLAAKQRRVLREYIWQVELGEVGVTAWLESEKCPVSPRAWYASGHKANYLHNDAFKEALALYRDGGQRWLITEEARTVEAAQRKLRLGAVKAADRMVDLVDNAGSDMVKLRAAEQVLDRADAATASKGPTGQPNMADLTDDELIAIAGRWTASSGGGGAAESGVRAAEA
jgi:hypothetical protein